MSTATPIHPATPEPDITQITVEGVHLSVPTSTLAELSTTQRALDALACHAPHPDDVPVYSLRFAAHLPTPNGRCLHIPLEAVLRPHKPPSFRPLDPNQAILLRALSRAHI